MAFNFQVDKDNDFDCRELYRDPEFLILDEATNALDEETEKINLEFLDNLKGKVTVLISSHRKNSFKSVIK